MRVGTVFVDGKKVRHLRSCQGWTQEDLARKTGCSKRTIENVEAGRPVLLYTVSCIAQALQIQHEDLLLLNLGPAFPRSDQPASSFPFSWRTGITNGEAFFDRDKEQHTLRKYLRDRQSCQIVGPRRIGKSSLLRRIERIAPHWEDGALVAYVDLQHPRCFTLAGWLEHVSRQFGFTAAQTDLVTFSEHLDDLLAQGRHPVLCLDEFEELTWRRQEFTRDFFAALRSCGQKPMSIITASQKRLRDLTDASDPSSPFYNIFPPLDLGPFATADAADFVSLRRPGVPPFSAAEKEKILEAAKGHPLALQVFCFHVLEAKENGGSWLEGIRAAEDEMNGYFSS